VLHNLKQLQDNPPSLYVSVCTEVESSLKETSKFHDSSVSAAGQNDSTTTTAFDIGSVDSIGIDWDIGSVEQPAKESGDGFGSYKIIDANIELAGSENYDVSVSVFQTTRLRTNSLRFAGTSLLIVLKKMCRKILILRILQLNLGSLKC
jgi:hypothetical protein